MTKGVQCIFVPKQFSYPFIIVIAEKNGREERARKEWRLRPTGSTRPFYYVGRISIRTIYPGWDRVSQGRKDDRSRRRNIGSVPRRYAIGSSVRIKNNNNYCEIFWTFSFLEIQLTTLRRSELRCQIFLILCSISHTQKEQSALKFRTAQGCPSLLLSFHHSLTMYKSLTLFYIGELSPFLAR
jgi:hypothetical protein